MKIPFLTNFISARMIHILCKSPMLEFFGDHHIAIDACKLNYAEEKFLDAINETQQSFFGGCLENHFGELRAFLAARDKYPTADIMVVAIRSEWLRTPIQALINLRS